MSEVSRTFLAIALPENVREELDRLKVRISADAPRARWVLGDQYHITLAFLGDVNHERLREIFEIMDRVCEAFAPIALKPLGLGAFPTPERPRTLWAGVSDPLALAAPRESLVRELAAIGLAPAADEHFHPHATLARFKIPPRPPDLSDLIAAHRGWTCDGWEASEVVAFASTLGPKGPSHLPLHRAPFRKNSQGDS